MSEDRSISKERMTSHGRGGAGNIKRSSETPLPEDLTTPTIKSENYTTGRGGAGNIAKNDPANPELARERQDVEAPVRRVSYGQSHYGRGGAANTFKMAPGETEEAKVEDTEQDKAKDRERRSGSADRIKGLAEKSKEIFKGKR